MERYLKQGTENTPTINFDPVSGNFEISGKSIPEDSMGFYTPVIEWLNEYIKKPADYTVFSFKLEYFNTSSSKILLDMFYLLEKISDSMRFDWYCDENDEDLEESAADFEEVLNFDINIVKFKR